jgi:hypothetical protein
MEFDGDKNGHPASYLRPRREKVRISKSGYLERIDRIQTEDKYACEPKCKDQKEDIII